MNPGIAEALAAVKCLSASLKELGQGFKSLETSPSSSSHRLYRVLLQLGSYTVAVDNYVTNNSQAQDVSILADERNLVQHGLMSLAREDESYHEGPMQLVCSQCWHAAIVYDLTVVFPLPNTAALFDILAVRMKQLISDKAVQTRWHHAPYLMLWITVMGAIAAIGSDLRPWYVDILSRLSHRLQIRDWDHLRYLLQHFLWHPSTNDSDGLELWEESSKSSSPPVKVE